MSEYSLSRRIVFACLIISMILVLGIVWQNAIYVSGNSDDRGLIGDLNNDGKVDSTDYILMRRYLLEIISDLPVPDKIWSADLNDDGKIDSTDAILMRRFLLEIISEFPKKADVIPTPIPSPTTTPRPTPIPVPVGDESSEVNVKKGEIFNYVFKANNIESGDIINIYRYTVTYNPEELEVIDLCSETYEKIMTPQWVKGTDIIIEDFNPTNGKIVFSTEKFINDTQKLSGAINSIKFRSNISGISKIDYTVERVSHIFYRDIVIGVYSFLSGGRNFSVYNRGANKSISFKTKITPQVRLTFYSDLVDVYVVGNSGSYSSYVGTVTRDVINIIITCMFPLIEENKDLGVELKIINNSDKRIRINLEDHSDRVTILDRNGNEITKYNNDENVICYSAY
ncbi:UNVERIFIED_CONTAM: dockerin type I repeat protein [Acetivibrio alkalicellulosi]